MSQKNLPEVPKYAGISDGYQTAMTMVDDVVLKNYVSKLSDLEIAPLNQEVLKYNIRDNVLFLKLRKWYTKKRNLRYINLPVYSIQSR